MRQTRKESDREAAGSARECARAALARSLPAVLLHLTAVSTQKARRIADETIEIYAPIANRLGLHSLF
ncbi:MAG: HD domain-containing protein, partial [Betaproteobacteria bacterium]|nr:HD domain-containing protein [Betaproteobacteria bacterium]